MKRQETKPQSGINSAESAGDEQKSIISKSSGSTPEGTLESALSFLGGGKRANRKRTRLGDSTKISFKKLLRWARKNAKIKKKSEVCFFSKPPKRGGEHEVWFDKKSQRVFKATFPNQFGVSWRCNVSATPVEYLHRLFLQNLFFEDDIQFEAVVDCEGHWRLLTSQPFVDGVPASPEQIERWLISEGFERFQSEGAIGWYNKAINLIVADAHPSNVILTPSGAVVPVDLLLLQPTGETKSEVIDLVAKRRLILSS